MIHIQQSNRLSRGIPLTSHFLFCAWGVAGDLSHSLSSHTVFQTQSVDGQGINYVWENVCVVVQKWKKKKSFTRYMFKNTTWTVFVPSGVIFLPSFRSCSFGSTVLTFLSRQHRMWWPPSPHSTHERSSDRIEGSPWVRALGQGQLLTGLWCEMIRFSSPSTAFLHPLWP